MADSDWIVLCDYAFPALNGKLCLIGIFETIFADAIPATHPRAAIGFNLIGEPGEQIKATIKIISPSAEVIARADIVSVLPDAGTGSVHLEIQGLALPEFGRYAIELDLGAASPKTAWFTLRKLVKPPEQ